MMRKIMVKILGIVVLLITLFLPNACAFANEEKTSWKQLAYMPTSRLMFQTEVIDGKIYAIGSCWDSNYTKILSPTEVYDPSTNAWSTLASMPIALLDYLQTEAIDGKIYAIGGWGTDDIPVTSTEVYDPATDAWTVLAPMSVNLADDFQTEVINGKIYAIGNIHDGTCTLSTEVYDPSTDTWTILASIPTNCKAFQTEVIDGKIYVLGGYSGTWFGRNSDIKSLSSAEVYDPSTDTWTTLASMSTTRCCFQTEVIDSKIYAIGGWNVSVGDSKGKSLSSAEVYNPSTDTWTTLASMSADRQLFQTELIDDKIYAFGGHGCNGYNDMLSSTEVYDPSTDTWTTLASMSKSRYFFHSEVIDKVIYALGCAGCSFESYTVDTNASK
ncbi:MAG: kelch repeat-containing protein [Candidatus Metalachnospira sp.]|nr:kelch repeat-containing protein [Candidatus Metalachnospira sp.]